MSVHTPANASPNTPSAKAITSYDIRHSKGKTKLSMLTAYDYTTALFFDAAGVDMLLVGDSVGMVVLGRDDTLSVTVDEIIHHCRAVANGAKRSLVVADMPFMSYEVSVEDALRNAARIMVEGGARAVKIEGAGRVLPQVRALVDSGIPVVGHLGLTPQRIAELGGFKVQGKSALNALNIIKEAKDLENAGCFAIVLEAVPAPVAAKITELLSIPTIGIGAGAACDGQVLVAHDILGLYPNFKPKFVKQYAQLSTLIQKAAEEYCQDIKSGAFPSPANSFSMPAEELAELDKLLAEEF